MRASSHFMATKCKHDYVPYPRELMALYCSRCEHRKSTVKSVAHYNRRRRVFRGTRHLLSAVAMFDAPSTEFLLRTRQVAGVATNTAHVHITLVDGLRAPVPELLQQLYNALLVHPTFKVSRVYYVDTKQKDKKLVCLEVEPMNVSVKNALSSLSSSPVCVLPQWQLHVALGTCSSSLAKDVIGKIPVTGTTVRVALETLALLAPNSQAAEMARPSPHPLAFTLPVIEPSYTPVPCPPA